MSETPPTVVFDLEFLFIGGQSLYVTATEGRDSIRADDARVRLELHPDPLTVEELIIHRPQLAYMRTVKRTAAPEVTIEDAGRIKLVGADV